jgi:uncharacterized protein (DUF2267 family)
MAPDDGSDTMSSEASAADRQATERFLERVEVAGLSREHAERATHAVLCALEQRLRDGSAELVDANVSQELRTLLRRCARHKGAAARDVGRREFFEIVGEDLGPEWMDLEQVVRVVLSALREHLGDGESETIARQLQPDLQGLWTEH